MAWVTAMLAAVLALSFSTDVHGMNACFTDTACAAGATQLFFENCGLTNEDLSDLEDCFDSIGRAGLQDVRLIGDAFTMLPSDLFESMEAVTLLSISTGLIANLDASIFQPFAPTLEMLVLRENAFTTFPVGLFDNMVSLDGLYLGRNQLETLPGNLFTDLESLTTLRLSDNGMIAIHPDAFVGLSAVEFVFLHDNSLTTLPAGVFEDLGSGTVLRSLHLDENPGLQCVPTVFPSGEFDGIFYRRDYFIEPLPDTDGLCECTPADAVLCDAGTVCSPGAEGYTCVPETACTQDSECDTANGESCCLTRNVCEATDSAGACGDPHMTGFRGQKFDFVGEDNKWYAVVSDLPWIHVNMRITSPVPSMPQITYITGLSVITTDDDGMDHTIVISVVDPHSLESSCPVGVSPCLADGALHVVADGEEVMFAPGEVRLAPGVAIAAVNLPGACRSFGFEKYWEQKKLDMRALSKRRLGMGNTLQVMSDWITSDPTATNMAECTAYVAGATAEGETGLFGEQSEHASFQIMTPTATIRLSHGRLHQLPMRDPTDMFDLPDHDTWQMNMAIDHSDLSLDVIGILGETLVPTVDFNGVPIMQGMDCIRGTQEDYAVKGPLDVEFAQGQRQE